MAPVQCKSGWVGAINGQATLQLHTAGAYKNDEGLVRWRKYSRLHIDALVGAGAPVVGWEVRMEGLLHKHGREGRKQVHKQIFLQLSHLPAPTQAINSPATPC